MEMFLRIGRGIEAAGPFWILMMEALRLGLMFGDENVDFKKLSILALPEPAKGRARTFSLLSVLDCISSLSSTINIPFIFSTRQTRYNSQEIARNLCFDYQYSQRAVMALISTETSSCSIGHWMSSQLSV